MLMIDAVTKANNNATIIPFIPKNIPSTNINLISPPPNTPGTRANSRSNPPPRSIPPTAFIKEILFKNEQTIPITKV